MDVLGPLSPKARTTFFRESLSDTFLPSSQSAAFWKRLVRYSSIGVPSSVPALLGSYEVSERREKTPSIPAPKPNSLKLTILSTYLQSHYSPLPSGWTADQPLPLGETTTPTIRSVVWTYDLNLTHIWHSNNFNIFPQVWLIWS